MQLTRLAQLVRPKAAIHRHSDVSAFVDAMCRKALQLTPQDIGLSSRPHVFRVRPGQFGLVSIGDRWFIGNQSVADQSG